MASVDQKLYRELKSKYPEIPDNVVTSCMTRFGNDRLKCMETLTQESPKYLYGNSSHGMNDPFSQFGESALEPRPRSDSSSSNMSNASSGSASSRPAFHTSHSFTNVPGYRGPITITDEGSPTSAPVRPSDLNQFITLCGGDKSTNIPHINCNNNTVRASYEGQKSNYGPNMGHLPSGNSPTQPTKPGLRPIEVHHIQSNMDHAENPSQPPITYQIRIDRGQGSSGHTAVGNASLPVTPERGGWSYHPVSHYKPNHNPQLHNNPQTIAFSSDPHLQPIAHFDNINITPSVSSQYKSPTEDYDQSFGAPKYNHSSQTKIFLNPVMNTNQQTILTSPSSYAERTVHSPLPGPYSIHGSAVSDQRNSPNFMNMRIKPVGSDMAHDLSNSPNPQGVGRPIVVEIRREGGVQSQIQYFNEIASGSNSGGPQVGGPHGTVIGPAGPYTDNIITGEQQGQTVINIKGVSPSHDEGGFLKFPPMSNVCRVPGHPSGHLHLVGSESDSVFRGDRDYRQNPARPFISPTSSHSSLSSESSAVMNTNTPHSGPLLYDDGEEYIQVLMSHQKSRMQKLREDLSAAEERLQQLKQEVSKLQMSSVDRKRKRTSPFPSAVDLTKLRGENLQLQADIQLMTREIDMYNNGQTPLGVLDPLEEQNFYTGQNFNTGQRGSIYASSGEPHPKVFTSTVTTSVTPSVPPQPQRPPPEIPTVEPPVLPPRDRDKKVEAPPPLPPRIVPPSHVPPPPPHQPQVGSGDSDADGDQWSCSACTFLNHPALNKCECCEMPRMNFSSISSPRDMPDTYPTQLQPTQAT